MRDTCLLCNQKTGIFTNKVKIATGYIHGTCLRKYLDMDQLPIDFIGKVKMLDLEAIKSLKVNFKETNRIDKTMSIDTNNRTIMVYDAQSGLGLVRYINFEDILSYEYKENNYTVHKNNGVGRAIVGGVLFGGFGAIVGATTGKTVEKGAKVTEMSILINVKDYNNPLIKLCIMKGEKYTKGDILYKGKLERVNKILSTLEIILNENNG